MRGRAFAFNQCVQFAVVPVVAFLSYMLVPLTPLGWDGWRWVVLIGADRRAVRLVPPPRHSGKPALAASTMAGCDEAEIITAADRSEGARGSWRRSPAAPAAA